MSVDISRADRNISFFVFCLSIVLFQNNYVSYDAGILNTVEYALQCPCVIHDCDLFKDAFMRPL